jgi:hypothetical protein
MNGYHSPVATFATTYCYPLFMFDQCHQSSMAKLKVGEKNAKQNLEMTTITGPNVVFILDICHKNKIVNKPA